MKKAIFAILFVASISAAIGGWWNDPYQPKYDPITQTMDCVPGNFQQCITIAP